MRGVALCAGRPAGDDELDRGLAAFLEHYKANIAVHSRPFDGVIEMIERFRARGAATAICTNKSEAMSRLMVETLELRGRLLRVSSHIIRRAM